MSQFLAYAKVNLTLDILGLASNGFHLLDTIIVPIKLADNISIAIKKGAGEVTTTFTNCPHIDFDTATKTAKMILDYYNITDCSVDIAITKNIPIGAGLGGSSADAASIAKNLPILLNKPSAPLELLAKIGSDIPAMTLETACILNGTGANIKSISLPTIYFVVVLNKKGAVDTTKAYKTYDNNPIRGISSDTFLTTLINDNALIGSNALQNASIAILPNISDSLALFAKEGKKAIITGSGSAVFYSTLDRQDANNVFSNLSKQINSNNYQLILTQTIF